MKQPTSRKYLRNESHFLLIERRPYPHWGFKGRLDYEQDGLQFFPFFGSRVIVIVEKVIQDNQNEEKGREGDWRKMGDDIILELTLCQWDLETRERGAKVRRGRPRGARVQCA